jgi:hypothetical protein
MFIYKTKPWSSLLRPESSWTIDDVEFSRQTSVGDPSSGEHAGLRGVYGTQGVSAARVRNEKNRRGPTLALNIAALLVDTADALDMRTLTAMLDVAHLNGSIEIAGSGREIIDIERPAPKALVGALNSALTILGEIARVTVHSNRVQQNERCQQSGGIHFLCCDFEMDWFTL